MTIPEYEVFVYNTNVFTAAKLVSSIQRDDIGSVVAFNKPITLNTPQRTKPYDFCLLEFPYREFFWGEDPWQVYNLAKQVSKEIMFTSSRNSKDALDLIATAPAPVIVFGQSPDLGKILNSSGLRAKNNIIDECLF